MSMAVVWILDPSSNSGARYLQYIIKTYIQSRNSQCNLDTLLHRTAQYCTSLPQSTLHCNALHSAAQHGGALHMALHCTELRCTAVCYMHVTTLHYTAFHCTSLSTALFCTLTTYQRVTTLGVIGRNGTPYIFARPKSAENTI